MANMAYCRMENTYHDLWDVSTHLEDAEIPEMEMSESEKKYREKIIKLCRQIAEWYPEEEDNNETK